MRRADIVRFVPVPPSLLAGVQDPDARRRVSAASDLADWVRGEVPPDDLRVVVAALLDQAARESDLEARESILNTLGEAADRPRSGELADWDPLAALLPELTDPECLEHALGALGQARHERYRDAIYAHLNHEDPRVREAAKYALAELDHGT